MANPQPDGPGHRPATPGERYDLPRREGSDHITPVDGMVATVMTRVESVGRHGARVVNATDPELLTAAEMEGRRQALEYARWQYLPDGEVVGIPYRTLIARDAANILVAGRCFSATHDAHASVRSMAQCMAMGQAAGTAAGLAAVDSADPREVSATRLRDRLRGDGAVLELAAPAGV